MIQMMPNNWMLMYLYSLMMMMLLIKYLMYFKMNNKKNKIKLKFTKW